MSVERPSRLPADAAPADQARAGSGAPPAQPQHRQRLDEEQRRQQIIAGCVQVLATHGYERASLALIAQAAGVSKGLLWHYFSDRDTLMEQVAITTVARLRDLVAAEIDLSAPVPAVIDAAVHRAAELGRTNPAELRAVSHIAQNLRGADGTLRLDSTYYEETYEAQERLFRRGQREGSLRDFDTRVMAVTYQGAIDSMLGYLQSHPGTDLATYADSLSQLLIGAVEAR